MLGADVAVGRSEFRVAKVVPDEYGVGRPGEDASGGVTQAAQLHAAQADDLAGEVVAAAER